MWSWHGGGKWNPYSDADARLLEDGWKSGSKEIRLNQTYYVDIKEEGAYTQRRYDDPSKKRPVRREEASAGGETSTSQTAPALSGERTLPCGWVAQYDPSTGTPYYAEVATGKTQWEFPVVNASTGGASSSADAAGAVSADPLQKDAAAKDKRSWHTFTKPAFLRGSSFLSKKDKEISAPTTQPQPQPQPAGFAGTPDVSDSAPTVDQVKAEVNVIAAALIARASHNVACGHVSSRPAAHARAIRRY